MQFPSYKKPVFLSLFVAFSFVHSAYTQNNNCNFDWNRYYFASAIGIDKNAERQSVNFLEKTIYIDYKSRYNRTIFNEILTKCNILATCRDGTKQTTAYVLRTACRNCFTCQSRITINITNISDDNVRLRIQNNASGFFSELYCSYNQHTFLKSEKFQAVGQVNNVIKKLWELNPFRCPDLNISKEAVRFNENYRIEHIPVIFNNFESNHDEIVVSFDNNGVINDLSFMSPVITISDNLSQDLVFKVQKFIEQLRTAYIIKDSGYVLKLLNGDNTTLLTDSQKDYLVILRKSFIQKQFINYKFQEIELSPLVDDPNVFCVSIHQTMCLKGENNDLGFLTLFLEFNKQGTDFILLNYKCSENKIDP